MVQKTTSGDQQISKHALFVELLFQNLHSIYKFEKQNFILITFPILVLAFEKKLEIFYHNYFLEYFKLI